MSSKEKSGYSQNVSVSFIKNPVILNTSVKMYLMNGFLIALLVVFF